MTDPDGERATPTAVADHHVGADVVPPDPAGSAEEVKIMHTLPHDRDPIPLPQDAPWFAVLLLREPRQAVQTAPVIAVVAELLDILRDEQVSDLDARHALTRALQWLRVFAGDPGRSPNRSAQVAGDREYARSAEELASASASRRFAAAWLRGTPHAAIRTEPVIAVVAELLKGLQWAAGSNNAQTRLRHAVRLLGVFVAGETHHGIQP